MSPQSVDSDVFASLSDRARDAPAQPPLHGREQPQHRGAQQNQLQHAIRNENSDDDLPRHRATSLFYFPLDHRCLDDTCLRKVGLTPSFQQNQICFFRACENRLHKTETS